ncbi:MAG: hypothetical protein IKH22_10435 [Prevotella sp.]|nr:hypothetical protein [Prevotella sp.]
MESLNEINGIVQQNQWIRLSKLTISRRKYGAQPERKWRYSAAMALHHYSASTGWRKV